MESHGIKGLALVGDAAGVTGGCRGVWCRLDLGKLVSVTLCAFQLIQNFSRIRIGCFRLAKLITDAGVSDLGKPSSMLSLKLAFAF